jgi:hypothetical protein
VHLHFANARGDLRLVCQSPLDRADSVNLSPSSPHLLLPYWGYRGGRRANASSVGQPRDLLEMALLTVGSMVGFVAAIAALLGLRHPARSVS